MKLKTLLTELAWLSAILIISYVLVIALLKPTDILNPRFTVSFHDTQLLIEGFIVVLFLFALLASVVYFVKEYLNQFNRKLQNGIALTTTLFSCLVLFYANYLYGGFVTIISNMKLLSASGESALAEPVRSILTNTTRNMIMLMLLLLFFLVILVVEVVRIIKARKSAQ